MVVGPNGSGKSNVADAIVWAAGSLTPSELRAEKPDDVLFGGAANRPPADHCEVELVFDNEDGGFGDEVDFSEIAITRRLVRGGEGQYLVNKAAVRRTDLVELLADVGLGGSMHSIVSQGKVDAVLASKPEDRRHLVEEAAGLGKFKRRKHRAELKLARVGIQVERAKDVEEEVRKRLRPLALQATAAERAEKLAIEIAALRARIAQLDLARRDRPPRRRRSAPRRRRDRPPQHAGEADRAARGAPAGRGRAVGRGRRARDGARRPLPPAGSQRAARAAPRVGGRARAATARRSRRGRARRRRSQRRDRAHPRGCRPRGGGDGARRGRGPRPGGRAGAPRARARRGATSAGSPRTPSRASPSCAPSVVASRPRSPARPAARKAPTAASSRSVPRASGSACGRSRRQRSSRR